MITVTICVGSSCHIKGAREMIGRFNDFLTKEGLEDKVELKGAFCMERCGEGINWKINDEIITSPSVEEGAKMFRKKVLKALKENAVKEPAKRSRRKKTRKT
jgi:NADH:ubiquinone oxidoreductase subunit E